MGLFYLKLAANHGLPEAQYRMGEYMNAHRLRSEDDVVAYTWYALAQQSGENDAGEKMKEMALRMSPKDVSEAVQRAKDWQLSLDNTPE